MGLNRLKSRRVSRAAFLLVAHGENLFPHLFQFLGANHIPWLLAASSIFKISSVASSNLSDSDPLAFLL